MPMALIFRLSIHVSDRVSIDMAMWPSGLKGGRLAKLSQKNFVEVCNCSHVFHPIQAIQLDTQIVFVSDSGLWHGNNAL